MNEDVRIYMAPNIRSDVLSVLEARTDERRGRRLLTAIEVNQKKQIKLTGQRDKDVEKFAKLVTSMEKRLNTVRDLLDKVDEELRMATNMHNAATLLDQELGS